MPELSAHTPFGSTVLRLQGDTQSVLLRELPFCAAIALRVDHNDPLALKRIADEIGLALPRVPNTFVSAGECSVLWQAYDEWLVLARAERFTTLEAALRRALDGARGAVTDVSDLRAGFEILGPYARAFLQKGCAVDLHPRVFGPGSCVQAALARVRAIVHQVDVVPTYHVLVERSYARYSWSWLVDAAREYASTR